MRAIDICVSARSTGNGRPLSGEARFSDGKTYEWSHHTGERDDVIFHTYKKMPRGGFDRFVFRSTLRANALLDALEGNDPYAVVEDSHVRHMMAPLEPETASADETPSP